MHKGTLVRTFLICFLAVTTASTVVVGQAPVVGSTSIPAVSQPAGTATEPNLDNLRALIFQPEPTNQASCNWDCQALYDQCAALTCKGCDPRLFTCSPSTCYYRCVCWTGGCP